MKIECRINSINKDNLLGYADLTIEDSLVIKGVSILNGRNGKFISFPQKKVGDKYYDIVFPITKELREIISKIILEKYENEYGYEERKFVNQDDRLPF